MEPPTDRVFVLGLRRLARHGVYDEERADGRWFEVDVTAHLSLAAAGASDALVDALDYRDLAHAALAVLDGPSASLVEHLADRIAGEVLTRYGAVSRVDVTVRKTATGVPGDPPVVGVAISRYR